MVAFIDQERDDFDVESICRVLPIASSTYYAAKRRESEPSARTVRDAVMMQVLMVLWVANRKVYGAHKLWRAARRAGHDIGRDQVARLMRTMGIEGVSRRRRKVFTTIADPDAVRAPDLVNRNFTAAEPNQLWVTDLAYVPTRTGMAYVCFIVDAFSRRIVGWRVASHMRTDMVLDALEMARRSRGRRRLIGLVAHADAGSLSSSPACASPNVSTRLGPAPRSGPLPTHSTTLWRRRPTASTRPSASEDPTPQPCGTTSTSSNSRPCHGSTGSTPTDSTATVTTHPPQSSKQRSTLPNRPPQPELETNRPSLYRTQGGSVRPV